MAQSKLFIEGEPQVMNQVLNSADVLEPFSQDLHHPTTTQNAGQSAGQTESGLRNLEPAAAHLRTLPDEISWPGLECWEPWGSERLPDFAFD